MKEGRLGHPYPEMDTLSCIDCGLCSAICPANVFGRSRAGDAGQDELFRSPAAAFAAWAKDPSEYVSSTSGGAASVLSRHFLSQGGAVYGSAVIPSGTDGRSCRFSVRHIRIENESGIPRLKGSKYVQSSISGILPQCRKDVRSGKPVLFIGTPCQTAALRCMFRKRPENLFLVDIVCHGVPSLALLKDYINGYMHISPSEVTGLSFRDERGFSMTVSDSHGIHRLPPLTGRRTEGLYYNLFMDGFTYRESCYSCIYAGIRRVSDMTIGDFWGLGKDVPEHPYGVSLIMPVTSKGKELIPVLKEGMHMYERSLDEASAGNAQLCHPKHKSLRIKLFRCIEPILGLRSYYLLTADWILKKLIKSR